MNRSVFRPRLPQPAIAFALLFGIAGLTLSACGPATVDAPPAEPVTDAGTATPDLMTDPYPGTNLDPTSDENARVPAAPAPIPVPPWDTVVRADDPLVGQVWSVADAAFVEPIDLVHRLAEADFVMLGEKHDNPDHHRIQAWLVEGIITLGRLPVVAFEQMTTDQEAALYDHLAANPLDAAGIADAIGWEESGWPAWEQYQPIAEAALAGNVAIVPANVPKDIIMGVSGMGAPPDEDTLATLGLDMPLPDEAQTALVQEIVDAHCGYLPEEMAPPMADAQRARDGGMASRLVESATELGLDGGILITGNGHARTDRGVPFQLLRLAPAATIVSLGILEVAADRATPADYAADFDDALPYDFLLFTPRLDDEDPCEKFAEQLQQMGGGDAEGAEGEADGEGHSDGTGEGDGDSDGDGNEDVGEDDAAEGETEGEGAGAAQPTAVSP